jgi:hypothetical protein
MPITSAMSTGIAQPVEMKAAFRHRNVVVFGIFRRNALRPGIGVHDHGRADNQQAADDADQVFGPHRPLGKAEARPPLAPGVEAENDDHAGEEAKHPARHRSDRALRSAAYEGESVVERRDSLARRHPPRCAAPEQLRPEGDDESGNAEIGDQRAVKGADRRADREGEDDRDDPDRRVFEAEIGRQNVDLRDADDGRDETDYRSDRKIDMTHDDDEHHARRHDRDR